MHYGRLPFSVHQKMPALPVLLVETASTSLLPKPDADHKTAVSAGSVGRR
jgi:hypothetical protein